MGNTDHDWEYWGRTDPYFGVLSEKRFGKEAIDAHYEEFFATGRHQIDHRLGHLEARLGPIHRDRALDFGCGVGRVSEALAARFNSVVGLDVSPAMLQNASANALAHGVHNATYTLSDDHLSRAEGSFDFIHSYIVLQHIAPDRGIAILSRLLALAAPNAVVSLHVCIGGDLSPWQAVILWCRHNLPVVRGLANLRRGWAWNRPAIRMHIYPLLDVMAAFSRAGIDNVVVDLERHGTYLTAHVAGRTA